jgi:hypothetical protein
MGAYDPASVLGVSEASPVYTPCGHAVHQPSKVVEEGSVAMGRSTTTFVRRAWDDRYNQPTAEQLREALPTEVGELFDALRGFLCELDNVTEAMCWNGECWRWTLEYRLPQHEEPLAVLIPSPEDLQLAMPVSPDLPESLPARPLKRAVREGLELGLAPFDTRWGVWSISYPKIVEELASIVEINLATVTGTARRRRA